VPQHAQARARAGKVAAKIGAALGVAVSGAGMAAAAAKAASAASAARRVMSLLVVRAGLIASTPPRASGRWDARGPPRGRGPGGALLVSGARPAPLPRAAGRG